MKILNHPKFNAKGVPGLVDICLSSASCCLSVNGGLKELVGGEVMRLEKLEELRLLLEPAGLSSGETEKERERTLININNKVILYIMFPIR